MAQFQPWCFEHEQDPKLCADYHAQREQHEAMVEHALMQGHCPYGGGELELRVGHEEGPRDPVNGDVWACGVCDCFGFGKEEVSHAQ